MAAAAPPPLDEAASGALVPYGMQQQQLQLMPGMGARMRHQALTQHRPLPNQLRNYCEALGGPSDRTPLIYTGDPQASMDRLHADVVAHYRQLSAVLNEPERLDLLHRPAGLAYGGLSLAGPSSSPLLLGPAPSVSYASAGLGLPSSSLLGPSSSPLTALDSGLYPSLSALRSRSNAAALGPLRGGQAAGLRPGLASAPTGAGLAGGVRASSFALIAPQPSDSSSLFVNESSQLLYPPVGSTFEGGPSHSVVAARRAGLIDPMADLRYKRAQPLQYDSPLQDLYPGAAAGGARSGLGAISSGPGAGMATRLGTGLGAGDRFRAGMSESDQLDHFLSDFAAGRAQPSLPNPLVALDAARPYKAQHVYSV